MGAPLFIPDLDELRARFLLGLDSRKDDGQHWIVSAVAALDEAINDRTTPTLSRALGTMRPALVEMFRLKFDKVDAHANPRERAYAALENTLDALCPETDAEVRARIAAYCDKADLDGTLALLALPKRRGG